jgi:tripartite-type tricarboxylate transporter receptor subunit TctC
MNTTFSRRAVISGIGALAAAPLAGFAQPSQSYPSQQLTIVVPSTAGGIIDVVARTLGARMMAELKQTIVIDNRAGGNGHIGASLVAKAKPDGYMLLCAAGSTLTSGVSRNLNYEPMKDLVPVARLVTSAVFLVIAADSPIKTVQDLIVAAKAKPGGMFFGSTSAGNSTHISAEMLNALTGMGATHVPYKGAVAALQDLVGGRIQFMLDTRPSIGPLIQAGKLRMIAVSSRQRLKDFPNVPSIAEAVPGYEIEGWVGIFAPAGTPKDIVDKLGAAVQTAIADPEVTMKLRAAGDVAFLPPLAARTFMNEDHERIIKVVRAANIVVE